MMRTGSVVGRLAACAFLALAAAPAGVQPPAEKNSTKFAVIGDSGTGDSGQYETAKAFVASREAFPFDFVLMMGDNLYGSERPQDFEKKFETPYRPLLDAKVNFYATLGNHDDPNQRFYKPFNMNGERYYTFQKGPVRFFVLDSNYMDQKQLDWLARELENSHDKWKMAYFHHPLYSSGARHGSEVDLREELEPLFVKNGVQVVFAGHEHFYERIKPQRGIHYFTCGGAAKLREGDIRTSTPLTAKGFDTDQSFMLVEVSDDVMRFQTISRAGQRVDEGSIPRAAASKAAAAPGAGTSDAPTRSVRQSPDGTFSVSTMR
jgi:predicted phosphodiesterase